MKKSIGANEFIFPNPVFVLGTYDKEGQPDMATFAWGGIAASSPPAISVAVRPSRLTYENLILNKAFTINLPTKKYVTEADYFGIVSGRDTDKLKDTGLNAVKGDFVHAPYIDEFPFNIECKVINSIDLKSHILFVGEVKDIKADNSLFDESGKLNLSNSGILGFDFSDSNYLEMTNIVDKAFSCGLTHMKD